MDHLQQIRRTPRAAWCVGLLALVAVLTATAANAFEAESYDPNHDPSFAFVTDPQKPFVTADGLYPVVNSSCSASGPVLDPLWGMHECWYPGDGSFNQNCHPRTASSFSTGWTGNLSEMVVVNVFWAMNGTKIDPEVKTWIPDLVEDLVAAPYWDAAELYTYTPPGGVSRGTTIPVSLGGTFTLTTPLTSVGDGQDCSAFTTQATCPSTTCYWDRVQGLCLPPVIQGNSCLDEAYSTQGTCPSWCHWSPFSNTCNDVVDGIALRGELVAQVLAGNLPAPDTGSSACLLNSSQAECVAHSDCAWSERKAAAGQSACMENPRLYYIFHFPGRVSIRFDFGPITFWSVENFCGYHDWTTIRGGLFATPIAFSVQPDFSENLPGQAERCGWGLGQSEDGSISGNTFDVYSELVTHELMETLTDPFANGWTNSFVCGAEEVSDICASYNWMIPRTKFETGRTYRNYWAVQSFYQPLDPANIGTEQAFCGVMGAVPAGFTPVNTPEDACSGQPDGTACDDGDACTQSDTCQGGSCTGSNPVSCAAADQCHVAGTCNTATGVCSNPAAADGTTCTDGNACTSNDVCTGGVCAGTAYACAAPDQCHQAGTCNGDGTCSFANKTDGTTCSDGNACTQSDTCQAGGCTAGAPVTCTASDQCHVAGTCNPQTGTCSNPGAPNGTSCTDGNQCTGPDTCDGSGACLSGPPVYGFEGFFPPVDNPNVVNTGKAGRAFALKWKLPSCAGGYVSRLGAVTGLTYRTIACDNSLQQDPVATDAAASGSSGLHYDSTANQYVYNWQTASSFANKCYEFRVTFDNGSSRTALFKFTK